MRVAICARFSADDGGDNSIATQIQRLRDWADERGWEVAAAFEANGESGGTMERTDIRGVTDLIHRDAIDAVLYLYSSRYNRDKYAAYDWERAVLWPANSKRALEGREPIRILFRESPDIDRATPDGFVMHEVQSTFDTAQRMRIRANTQRGMDQQRSKGLWLGQPPFGTIAGSTPGIPVRCPDTWERLLWIYEQAAAGVSMSAIADRLEAQGVRGRRGGRFMPCTVAKLLRSRFYLGERQSGEPLLHDCRVERGLWERATAGIRRSGERVCVQTPLLRGLAVCSHYRYADTGRPVPLYHKQRGGYIPRCFNTGGGKAYREEQLARVLADVDAPRFFPAAEVDTRVMEAVLADTDAHGGPFLLELEREIDAARVIRERELRDAKAELSGVAGELRKAQKRLDGALDAGLPKETIRSYDANIRALRSQEQALRANIADLEAQLADWPELIDFRQRLGRVNLLRAYWEAGDIATCNSLLRCIVRYVDVRGVDDIEIGYMVRLSVLSETQVTVPCAAFEWVRGA